MLRSRTRGYPLVLLLAAVLLAGVLPSPIAAGGNGKGPVKSGNDCKGRWCDTTPPDLSIATPTAGSIVDASVTVAGTASDAGSGLGQVTVSAVGLGDVVLEAASSWSTTLDVSALPEGSLTVTVDALDKNLNLATASVEIAVDHADTTTQDPDTPTEEPDTTPPSAGISSPGDGAVVDGVFEVAGVSDDDRSVDRVELRVDAGSWRTVAGTTSWQASVDTSAWAADSSHTVAARAVDAAGNASALASITVHKAAAATEPIADPSDAPDTQGSWVSPEGVTINVATAGPWTIRKIYTLLLENATAPGDFAEIAPTITVEVQDENASQTTTGARSTGGVYYMFAAKTTLKGVNSSFASWPDKLMAHEYGHAWSRYHLFMSQNGDWSKYLGYRLASADGTTLAEDSRLDSSYAWSRGEIIADDYRLLFGSAAARQQGPTHMNPDIPEPTEQLGLRNFLESTWAA